MGGMGARALRVGSNWIATKHGRQSTQTPYIVMVNNYIFPWSVRGLFILVIFLSILGISSGASFADVLEVIDDLILTQSGGDVNLLPLGRGLFAALSMLSFLFVVVLSTQWAVAACLHYTGWLYEPIGQKPSLPTRMYMGLVYVLNKLAASTMSFQRIIPTQPIPPVDRTVKQYLRTMRPLMSDREFAELQKMGAEFENGLAMELQWKLRMKQMTAKNYVTDIWKEIGYMRNRETLIGTNVACADLVNIPTAIQAARAAQAVLMHLQFLTDVVEKQTAKPITLGGIPMCSQQYVDCYRSLRVPHETADQFVKLPHADHIAVYRRGCWYTVQVLIGGKLISAPELETALQQIIDKDDGVPSPGEARLSALTAGPRDLWAKTRRKIYENNTSGDSLSAIENSLDIIFLDDEERFVDPDDMSKYNREIARCVTGDGYAMWYDKPTCYLVSANGRCTPNAEHSVFDALIPVHFREHARYHEEFSGTYDAEGHCTGTTKVIPVPQRLRWDLNKEIQSSIEEAYTYGKKIADDFDCAHLLFEDYGKDAIKKFAVSPDAFIQLAFQLAYFRDQGRFDLTYEPAVMRLWNEGRTETIRSCSDESCAFVRAMQNSAESSQSRLELLRKSCERHQELTKDAMAGKGADRHLFALYVVSKYLQKKSPFLEKIFSMNFALSTSQVPQSQIKEMSSKLNGRRDLFWPGGAFACPQGSNYGIGYTIGTTGDLFSFWITSWKSNTNSNAARFRGQLERALRDMRHLIDAN